ncbi:hypothetical protein OU994_06725 [Pseudoduganella sp. SL102]|uniref:T6SS effector phospholipase Tle3 domain-containing protein n=1 Tax=Pseudoduganella sp. SL102 TaxID=2995154 RepID=UPI00248B8464|nr:hypothetical protein [Pseudoduganella sp. SL102]WBS03977.1 hypothetical protein OU994_06725 [Pseudoduganella sp. SL102]
MSNSSNPHLSSAKADPKEMDVVRLSSIEGASGVTLLRDSYLDVLMQMPLPGIVIFVHGVNSDGEWYDQAEKGICAGLNQRLKRCDEHLAHPTPAGGQLTPVSYIPELTDDGFINAKRTSKTFVGDDNHFSPVIRFRWGYKASLTELQEFGDAIYLNEENYWGGGPFANGCTALPDLWSAGLSENLFLWMNVQHINPVPGRQVFSCPPRPYFVLAALRLAKLIKSIRELQVDVPITIVCHSQGNMIGMAAAFLGDRMPAVKNSAGREGRCVADTYVLCNPPYSVLKSNFLQSWTESHMKDRYGGTGRQTEQARMKTLRAFFDIIRRPASEQQKAEDIDKRMANSAHGFDIASDRQACGYGPRQGTCGRVTLYCNPHDQVISATSIQGIGWRGMNQEEITAAGGAGVFSQRVFAQNFKVGVKSNYHYWNDRHNRNVKAGNTGFWIPASPKVKYSISQGLSSNKTYFGKVITFLSTPVIVPITVTSAFFGACINAEPGKNWSIPIDAPTLPSAFEPVGMRFGKTSDFDEYYDAPGQDRDANRVRDPGDPYAENRPITQRSDEPNREQTDAGKGNRDSEASRRYEDHARLRMLARREKMVKPDEKVTAEDNPEQANDEYKAWRAKEIKRYLTENIDSNATDHSTIMTNPMHAEQALAYDVAVGMCRIPAPELQKLRIEADWRLWRDLPDTSSQKTLSQYFQSGQINDTSVFKWANDSKGEASMPLEIEDRRENAAPPAHIPAGD